jgi:hypothetical protein
VVIESAMVGRFVGTSTPSVAGQKVAIVAIMLYVNPLPIKVLLLTIRSFVFFYGLFIDAASFIYSSEIYPTNIRSEGVALATFTYFAACITFVTPGATAIASIGYKYFVSKSPAPPSLPPASRRPV